MEQTNRKRNRTYEMHTFISTKHHSPSDVANIHVACKKMTEKQVTSSHIIFTHVKTVQSKLTT